MYIHIDCDVGKIIRPDFDILPAAAWDQTVTAHQVWSEVNLGGRSIKNSLLRTIYQQCKRLRVSEKVNARCNLVIVCRERNAVCMIVHFKIVTVGRDADIVFMLW